MYTDDRITYDELGPLYELVFDANSEWHSFGLKLGIKAGTLDSIGLSCSYKPRPCLLEMLKHRLQSGGPLTWRELCDCLKSPTVCRHDIAEAIEASLVTGAWLYIRTIAEYVLAVIMI